MQSQNWKKTDRKLQYNILSQPKQNAETDVKRFSCLRKSQSVSATYGLTRKQRI